MDDPLLRIASAAELEARVKAGGLHESQQLDAKRELPPAGKNAALAIDIAAMATYGGTIIFGIAENSSGEPTVPTPLALAGVKERLNNIASTSISPPVHIIIKAHSTSATEGYVILTVPPSPFAPHMVMVKEEYRYYARDAQGNRLLTEPEIAALYERRRQVARSAEETLRPRLEALSREDGNRRLACVLSPAGMCPSLADLEHSQCVDLVNDALRSLVRLIPQHASRHFVLGNWRSVESGWGVSENGYELRVSWDLETSLVDTAAIHTHEGTRWLHLPSVVDSVARLVLFGATLATHRGYFGPIDVGIRITGLLNANMTWAELEPPRSQVPKYPGPEYSRFARADAVAIADDPSVVVRELLRRFIRTASADRCPVLSRLLVRPAEG